jgi:hypothetical protein
MRSRCGHDAALRTVRQTRTRRLDAALVDVRFVLTMECLHSLPELQPGHAEREATTVEIMSGPADEHQERSTARCQMRPIYLRTVLRT